MMLHWFSLMLTLPPDVVSAPRSMDDADGITDDADAAVTCDTVATLISLAFVPTMNRSPEMVAGSATKLLKMFSWGMFTV